MTDPARLFDWYPLTSLVGLRQQYDPPWIDGRGRKHVYLRPYRWLMGRAGRCDRGSDHVDWLVLDPVVEEEVKRRNDGALFRFLIGETEAVIYERVRSEINEAAEAVAARNVEDAGYGNLRAGIGN